MRMPREVRTLVIGNMVLGGLQTGKVQEALLGEGLARALRASNELAEQAVLTGQWDAFRRYHRIGDWIRRSMDEALEERVFGQVLKNYEEPLAEQSFEAVSEALEELPASIVLGFHGRLPEILEAQPRMPSPQGELFAAGQFLAAGIRQLYLPTLAFGAERGLFRPEDLGPGASELRGFQTSATDPGKDFILVDVEHLETLRLFEGVADHVRRDWGRVHPLVRGYAQVLGRWQWLDETGANRLRPAAEEVEHYLREPRH
ncbi:MAG: hypothetical protein IT572_07750 [Deltaproteobacteria bacterium]|nr:hypothetical protein [Deltaproteobacteria bacterium]